MKIKKLLPIALALVFCTTPVFADTNALTGAEEAKTDYSISVPDFLKITLDVPGQQSATLGTFSDTYNSATLDNNLTGTFKVVTNHEQDVYLYGVCEANTGTANALVGSPGSLALIFTNEGKGTRISTATDLSEITTAGASATTKNANAIAFAVSVSPTMEANSYATGDKITTDTAIKEGALKYTLPNSITTFEINVDKTVLDNTLSTLDETGTYKATLYLTNTYDQTPAQGS